VVWEEVPWLGWAGFLNRQRGRTPRHLCSKETAEAAAEPNRTIKAKKRWWSGKGEERGKGNEKRKSRWKKRKRNKKRKGEITICWISESIADVVRETGRAKEPSTVGYRV
jgi:hypothetical protein